ncbi:MAG: DUF3108 domain-containing protein [Planctomycetes bacterium]|nr:DUF3108 domain-containing protein [Planctomycetota bacterium]
MIFKPGFDLGRFCFRLRRSGLAASLAVLAGVAGSPWAALRAGEEPEVLRAIDYLPRIADLMGEELVYRGRIFKGGLSMDVGEAVFRVLPGDEPGTVKLAAEAEGGKLGYTLEATTVTLLEMPSGRPIVSTFEQRGSENREKRFLFRPGHVFYLKKKHCKDPNCGDPNHMVDKVHWAGGVVPWGTERVHCPGCDNPAHFVWTQREHFTVKDAYMDPLACIYAARGVPFEVGGAKAVFPIVQDHDLWSVEVRAVGREAKEVDAGTFACLQVSVEPKPASEGAEIKDEFQGVFGIQGSIQIWIDERTRIPVLVRGSIPFAFMTLHAEVILKEIRSRPAGPTPASAKEEEK